MSRAILTINIECDSADVNEILSDIRSDVEWTDGAAEVTSRVEYVENSITDALMAQISILQARQEALREYPYNNDFSLEARVIDKTIEKIKSKITDRNKEV